MSCPGINVNAQSTVSFIIIYYETPLHIAVRVKRLDIIEELLKHPDINIHVENVKGILSYFDQTPFDVAADDIKDKIREMFSSKLNPL